MFIAIDQGGTKTCFLLANEAGGVVAKFKSPSGLYKGTWFQALISGIESLLKEAKTPLKNIKAIGLGTPDIIIEFQGKKFASQSLIKALLEKKFGLPVLTENDATAAALGELYYGAAKGKKNCLYLILGTGIGGAVIVNGKLYKGATGRAGEFGHVSVDANGLSCGCGNQGCLHLYASGQSIAKRALQKILDKKAADSKIIQLAGGTDKTKDWVKKVSAAIVIEAAKQGDSVAKEVLAESLHYLGIGILSLINTFNPEAIIVGGGLAAAKEQIFPYLKEVVKKGVRKELFGKVEIVPSALGEEAGILGALILAQRFSALRG